MNTITNPTIQIEGSIQDIKNALGLTTLPLRQSIKDGEYTGWVKYFNHSRRLQVSMHEDTLKYIKANPTAVNLGTQYEERKTDKGTYDSYRVVAYNTEDVVDTL